MHLIYLLSASTHTIKLIVRANQQSVAADRGGGHLPAGQSVGRKLLEGRAGLQDMRRAGFR